MDHSLRIAPEDPRSADARVVLEAHLRFAAGCTPEGHVHALDVEGLVGPEIQFRGARRGGALVAVGALRDLGEGHFEIKSMHTLVAERGRGTGRAMLAHLLDEARARGARRVSLETGTMDAFVPARALYAAFGFAPCPPFGGYWENPHSVCMTLAMEGDGAGPAQA